MQDTEIIILAIVVIFLAAFLQAVAILINMGIGAYKIIRRHRAWKKRLIEKLNGDKSCDHSHWCFSTHGRRCSCGTLMVDAGD